MKNFNLPALGGGAGLRHENFEDIVATKPPIKWFEIINENFLGYGGREREFLKEIRKNYPIIGHSIGMSIGSTDPLDREYLKETKEFLADIESPWSSDHLCFTMIDHTNLSELIPLPFTQEAVDNCVERIKTIQNTLEVPFLVENVTRYITVSDREMSEAEFVTAVVEGADCGLLLDVTNVYINSVYHNYDPLEFIKSLPLERVGQFHLAGFKKRADGTFIDSHDSTVPEVVWNLFREIIALTGPGSALIEWDSDIADVETLTEQALLADKAMQDAAKEKAA